MMQPNYIKWLSNYIKAPEFNLNKIQVFFYGGGGGGQKTKWKTPSSNFEELIESITNMLLFFAGGLGKKVMRCQSLGGGGGGLCLK